jgi:nitroreductase
MGVFRTHIVLPKMHNNNTTIKNAFEEFQKIQTYDFSSDWSPYPINQRPPISISHRDLNLLALRRRSIREYYNKAIDPQIVSKAVKTALLSPSACNRQAFKFLFFNNPSAVKKISEIPGGVSGYSIPNIFVVVGQYRGYFDERDINAPLIDASLSTMTLIFALETLGISTVCINWPNIAQKEEAIRKIISLAPDEFIVMLLGAGYAKPNALVPYSAKKSTESMLLINQGTN